MRPFALQKTVFCLLKDGISHGVLPLVAFCMFMACNGACHLKNV